MRVVNLEGSKRQVAMQSRKRHEHETDQRGKGIQCDMSKMENDRGGKRSSKRERDWERSRIVVRNNDGGIVDSFRLHPQQFLTRCSYTGRLVVFLDHPSRLFMMSPHLQLTWSLDLDLVKCNRAKVQDSLFLRPDH